MVGDIDPRQAGEPVRVHFVLVRSDLLAAPESQLRAIAASILGCDVDAAAAPLASRLLPAGCDLLSWFGAPAEPRSKGTKWRAAKWRAARRLAPRVPLIPSIRGIGERSTAMLEVMLAKGGMRDVPPNQNIDVSQSMGRCRFTEFIPTITPGAKIVVGCRRRILSPIEMLLLNGIPVGELAWPSSLAARHLADMAGNTMHCMAAPSLVAHAVPVPERHPDSRFAASLRLPVLLWSCPRRSAGQKGRLIAVHS